MATRGGIQSSEDVMQLTLVCCSSGLPPGKLALICMVYSKKQTVVPEKLPVITYIICFSLEITMHSNEELNALHSSESIKDKQQSAMFSFLLFNEEFQHPVLLIPLALDIEILCTSSICTVRKLGTCYIVDSNLVTAQQMTDIQNMQSF